MKSVPLYWYTDSTGQLSKTTENLSGSRPYILYSDQHGNAGTLQAGSATVARGTQASVNLYRDPNGNLTTTVTDRPTQFRGFQRGNLWLNQDDSLSADSGYQQAIVVTNQPLYLDESTIPTTRPTNNRQWILENQATTLRNFNASGNLSTSTALYLDKDQQLTTWISNPSIQIDSQNQTGFAVPLYLDAYGNNTTLVTANLLYGQTDNNAASLIWYDSEGLSVETASPPVVPRVQDNGTSAGTALYDLPDNQPATLEVDRLKLIVGTRPFEVYQALSDAGRDRLVIEHQGASSNITGTIDYDPATDTTTVAGVHKDDHLFTGEAIEAVEVKTGAGADHWTIDTSRADATLRTGGAADTVVINDPTGSVHLYTEAGNDTINIKSIAKSSTADTGADNDTITVNNGHDRLVEIRADLAITGAGGTDIVHLIDNESTSDAAGHLTAQYLTGLGMSGRVIYDTIETLNIHLGKTNNDLTIESTSASTTTSIATNEKSVAFSPGNDTIRVKTIAGPTNITTRRGDDTVEISSSDAAIAGIQALLTIDTATGNDSLRIDDSGATTGKNGTLTDNSLTGLGMASGITYLNFESILLLLGSHDDLLNIASLPNESNQIDTGPGKDTVKVETYAGETLIKTGDDGDKITVFDGTGDNATAGARLTINGGDGGDLYDITAAPSLQGISFINLQDDGGSGDDQLTFRGSSGNDMLQLDTIYDASKDPEREFNSDRWTGDDYGNHGEGVIVAHYDSTDDYSEKDINDSEALFALNETNLAAGTDLQIINYSTIENSVIYAGNGDDKIIGDDTAQVLKVYGNAGDDQFFIGSVLKTETVLADGREVAIVTSITHGTSHNASFFGGADDDYFEVNHTTGDIGLFGDNGDDVFFVKALLTLNEDEDLVELKSKTATVSGVSGEESEHSQKNGHDTREVDSDALVYIQNANIKIDGGAGFDSVAVVGTVLSDTFYIYTEVIEGETVQRIYGAGVNWSKC